MSYIHTGDLKQAFETISKNTAVVKKFIYWVCFEPKERKSTGVASLEVKAEMICNWKKCTKKEFTNEITKKIIGSEGIDKYEVEKGSVKSYVIKKIAISMEVIIAEGAKELQNEKEK